MTDRINAQIAALESESSDMQTLTGLGLAPFLLAIASLRYLSKIESNIARSLLTLSLLSLAISISLSFLGRLRVKGIIFRLHTAMTRADFDEAKTLESCGKEIKKVDAEFDKHLWWIMAPLLLAYTILFGLLIFAIWVL